MRLYYGSKFIYLLFCVLIHLMSIFLFEFIKKKLADRTILCNLPFIPVYSGCRIISHWITQTMPMSRFFKVSKVNSI